MSNTRQKATEVVKILQEAGHQAVFAGGCVRDKLLGLEPSDFDIATSATPEDVEGLFANTIPLGREFGIVVVIHEGENFECATFRNDGEYIDGRRPDSVEFATIEDDAKRRDFTINALFEDPITEAIFDFVGGVDDLQNKILRPVGDADARFEEDSLRLLRAIRFAVRFKLKFAEEVLDKILNHSQDIHRVSAERIGDELTKIFAGYRGSRALFLLNVTGLAKEIIPEVDFFDVTERTNFQEPIPPSIFFAALFAGIDSEVARDILIRLRRSTELVNRVVLLMEESVKIPGALTLSCANFKRFIRQDHFGDIAEAYRVGGGISGAADICLRTRLEASFEELFPKPFFDGRDLIAKGLKPGPKFTKILKALENAQLEGKVRDRVSAEAFIDDGFWVDGISKIRP